MDRTVAEMSAGRKFNKLIVLAFIMLVAGIVAFASTTNFGSDSICANEMRIASLVLAGAAVIIWIVGFIRLRK